MMVRVVHSELLPVSWKTRVCAPAGLPAPSNLTTQQLNNFLRTGLIIKNTNAKAL